MIGGHGPPSRRSASVVGVERAVSVPQLRRGRRLGQPHSQLPNRSLRAAVSPLTELAKGRTDAGGSASGPVGHQRFTLTVSLTPVRGCHALTP